MDGLVNVDVVVGFDSGKLGGYLPAETPGLLPKPS